jgi:hypothetical protein
VTDCDLIAQFFLRVISGIFALVVGTGLCYFLFIGSFLRRIEIYKERLRAYKEVHEKGSDLLDTVKRLKTRPEGAELFGEKIMKFSAAFNTDRMFMASRVVAKFNSVRKSVDELPPDTYPEPSSPVRYSEIRLMNLEHDFEMLLEAIRGEIQSTQFGVLPDSMREFFKRPGL